MKVRVWVKVRGAGRERGGEELDLSEGEGKDEVRVEWEWRQG